MDMGRWKMIELCIPVKATFSAQHQPAIPGN